MFKITRIGSYTQPEIEHQGALSSVPVTQDHILDAIRAAWPDQIQQERRMLHIPLAKIFDSDHVDTTTVLGTKGLDDPLLMHQMRKLVHAIKWHPQPWSPEYTIKYRIVGIDAPDTDPTGIKIEVPDGANDWSYGPVKLITRDQEKKIAGAILYGDLIGMPTNSTGLPRYPFCLVCELIEANQFKVISINGQEALDGKWYFKSGTSLTVLLEAPSGGDALLLSNRFPVKCTVSKASEFAPWSLKCDLADGNHDLGIQFTCNDSVVELMKETIAKEDGLGLVVISPQVPVAPVITPPTDVSLQSPDSINVISGTAQEGNVVELLISDVWATHTWRLSGTVTGGQWTVALTGSQQFLGGTFRLAARAGVAADTTSANSSIWSATSQPLVAIIGADDQIQIDGVQKEIRETGTIVTVWGHCAHRGNIQLHARSPGSRPVQVGITQIATDGHWKISFQMGKGLTQDLDLNEVLAILDAHDGHATSRVTPLQT
ncbi:hypothetical protein [Burkholderia cenocepacia]|uniref:hypothetical protein n=1 Tax=Burkholderia cenocepacia TaxID=95486 RepID=UPI000F5A1C56|nr:hypothetical protein [Burkholderia cenocepacia]